MIHLNLDYQDDNDLAPGEYLRYHRTFQGIPTKKLAEKVGVVPATLNLYEQGKHPIKHSAAVALAQELGIDRQRLLDEYTTFVDSPCGELLQRVRNELSMTQGQIAAEIGVAQNSYSGWERGSRTPRRKEYEKIASVFRKHKVDICRLANLTSTAQPSI